VVQWCACWFGDRGKNGLGRKPGPRDRANPAGPMWATCTAFETKPNACTFSRFRRSPQRMCDIRTVDPISLSQLIVSQSQLLPSFWPVIGAKLPVILALLCARAPTQRPERLQENVIERPFMHPQSQRSIPRVYLYRLRSIHPKLICQPLYSLRENFCSAFVNVDLLHHHPIGSRTATNLLMLCLIWSHIVTNAVHRNGSAMVSTFEQCVSCEV
jgi:hypothetical protein